MKVRIFILISIVLAMALHSEARKGKKPDPSRRSVARVTAKVAAETVNSDTIVFPPSDSVVVAGYEKTLRSTTESMIVSNHTSHDIRSLGLDICYMDMSDRMLHRVSREVSPEDGIPSGESRMVSVPSFDRQGLFYYHRSPRPKRAARATPFKVNVKIRYICIPSNLQTLQQ